VPMLSFNLPKADLCTVAHYVGANYNCVMCQESIISGKSLKNYEIIDTSYLNSYFYVSVLVILTKEV
jgi:hypothetical protein